MAQEHHANIILSNARVLTMEPANPTAWFVAVRGDKILGVGSAEAARRFKGPHTVEIDCQGMALLPGFNDAHCHLMALASSLRGVTCRPDVVTSISQIVEAISRRAEVTPLGRWIRAFGYDEFYLAEKRHPTRRDLDKAVGWRNPVRLDHRTGHASVLNSRALELLSISRYTPDPVDGLIERDEASGEPTGVLFEMGDYLRRATELHRDEEGLLEGIKMANNLLLAGGITSVQDASPGNDLHRWQTFRKLKEEGYLTPRVTMMAGVSRLQTLLDQGITPGSGDEGLRLGAVKVMLGLSTGSLQPHQEELRGLVMSAHEGGFQIAIHAVEEEAVAAAVDAVLYAQATLPRSDPRHRIEHCSECPPRVLEKLKASRALVVTQPSFIYHNGEKYLSLTEEESALPHLYPVGSFVRAGIPLAAGSDAPVTYPDPLLSIYSAVTRRVRGAGLFSPSQAVTVQAALEMHTINSAHASFEEGKKGSISVGKLADLALLEIDPTAVEPEGVKEIKPMMTMVGGKVAWQR